MFFFLFVCLFLGFSLAFVFKRQSTVKTQQNGHLPFGPPSDSFPLFFCIATGECETWSFKSLKGNGSTKRDGHTADGEARNGTRGTATETAKPYRRIGPCGVRILSEKQSRPIVKKRDFYKGTCQGCLRLLELLQELQMEKNRLCR